MTQPPGAPAPAGDAAGGPQSATRESLLARQLPRFSPRQKRVFWISTTAGFFDSYDGALLSLALRQIQNGLGVAETALGGMLSAIRLGYLGVLLIAPMADVFGRRNLLLFTVVGYSIFTGLSAIAPHASSFIWTQILARAFSGAEATVSLVILAEEVDAAVRGWAIGLQGALAITGYGVAAIVFGFIAVIPYGWRGLYALALLPLAVIIPLRRILPESHRFTSAQAAGVVARNVLAPLAALVKSHPGRVGAVSTVWLLFAMGSAPGAIFIPKYLQEVHRWTPARVSLLYVFGGAIGILGNVVAGRTSDRYGRRTTGVAFIVMGTLLEFLFYLLGGGAIVGCWIGWLFCDQAATTLLNAYGAELFPTRYRSAAGSMLLVARYGGGAIGLMLEGVLYSFAASHWSSIRRLLSTCIVAAVIMLFSFPETAGRELESIAAERAPGSVDGRI